MGGDGAAAEPPAGIEAEDSLDDLDLAFDGDQGVLGRFQGEAVRDLPERPLALGCLALHPVDDPVDDHLTFELGEHAEHLDQHPPRRGGGVEWLGRRPEHDSGAVEFVEQGD